MARVHRALTYCALTHCPLTHCPLTPKAHKAHGILRVVEQEKIAFWKRFFMWDYPRGSVAYDVKVGAILAFIFLTPASVFRDQPTLSPARDEVVMLPRKGNETRFWIEESVLAGIPAEQQRERLSTLLSERTGKRRQVIQLEAVSSTDEEMQGYIVVTNP
jgi:hypothetical protein